MTLQQPSFLFLLLLLLPLSDRLQLILTNLSLFRGVRGPKKSHFISDMENGLSFSSTFQKQKKKIFQLMPFSMSPTIYLNVSASAGVGWGGADLNTHALWGWSQTGLVIFYDKCSESKGIFYYHIPAEGAREGGKITQVKHGRSPTIDKSKTTEKLNKHPKRCMAATTTPILLFSDQFCLLGL